MADHRSRSGRLILYVKSETCAMLKPEEIEPQKALAIMKVILAAAWADGSLQPEEIPALKQAITDLGLAELEEIKILVQTPISPSVYRHFFQDYLKLHPTDEERHYLLDLVTQVIYADDQVSVEEAYILEELRELLRSSGEEDHPLRLGEFQALFSRLLARSPSAPDRVSRPRGAG